MEAIQSTIDKMSGWLKIATELGVSIIMVAVVVDILFGGTTGVTANIGTLVGQFSKEGIAGLVALLMFLIIFKNKN